MSCFLPSPSVPPVPSCMCCGRPGCPAMPTPVWECINLGCSSISSTLLSNSLWRCHCWNPAKIHKRKREEGKNPSGAWMFAPRSRFFLAAAFSRRRSGGSSQSVSLSAGRSWMWNVIWSAAAFTGAGCVWTTRAACCFLLLTATRTLFLAICAVIQKNPIPAKWQKSGTET